MVPVLELSPSEGEVKSMTRNRHPVWDPWYVNTLPIPSRIPSKPSFNTALPSGSWCRVAAQHPTSKSWMISGVISQKESGQMFDIWQVPDFWQRVRWSDFVCVESRQTLFCSCVPSRWTLSCVLLRQKDSAQITVMGHQGCSVQYSVPWRNEGEKLTIHKGPFSKKEILQLPGRTEMPRKERGGLRHPWGDSGRSAERKKYVNWLCSLGEQSLQTFLSARGKNFFYWDTTSSVLESSSKVCKLILLPHPHSWLELGYHTFL